MEELNLNPSELAPEGNEGVESDDSVVSLTDLFQQLSDPSAADNQPKPTETVGNQAPRNGDANRRPSGNEQEKIANQTDFNRVLGSRLREERSKIAREYENNPAFTVGQRVIQEYMAREGLTEEQAARKFLDERAEALADHYQKNPKEYIKAQLQGQFNPQQNVQRKPAQNDYDPDTTDSRAAGEVLSRMEANGELPEGFGQNSIDQNFANDVRDYGVRVALRIWERANSGVQPQGRTVPNRSVDPISTELERRQRYASPMKVNGGDAETKPIDYNTMTKEQFAEMDKRIEQGMKQGKRFAP